ncbi:MAG: STAS domain-containing protein [Acidobacteriia bacterium]|nr:STAS domain-containing protein [Terriglobia bacterium]
MNSTEASKLPEILRQYEAEILSEWLQHQLSSMKLRSSLIREADLREQSRKFLAHFGHAIRSGDDIGSSSWAEVRELLADLSRTRARQGFTPSETAAFIFSLKKPLFTRLREACGNDIESLAVEIWALTELVDTLGLLTAEAHQRSREDVIARQQQELMELSTPVVKLWDNILALPLIGTLDSERTQVVMENLLQQIVQTGAAIAIIDITGVPTVDTLVAQHLMKTVSAAGLMGADCIISGVRPQIAQTIVHLGVELGSVATKATLADAFRLALRRLGATISRTDPAR